MINLEMGQPFIHIFRTPSGHYIYDVNTNTILKVSKDTHEYLNTKVCNLILQVTQNCTRKMQSNFILAFMAGNRYWNFR